MSFLDMSLQRNSDCGIVDDIVWFYKAYSPVKLAVVIVGLPPEV